MTTEQLVIALVRVAGSLPVLRWPLFGTLLAIAVDLADLAMMDALHLGGVPDYQAFDKALDLVYMGAFLLVAARWRGLEQRIAIALWAYRMVGIAAFEVTGQREVLLAFPNVFEFWFVLVAVRHHVARPALTPRQALSWLVVLTLAKEAQEYVLHVGRWLDRYTFFEFFGVLWQTVVE